ncbi:TIGR04211 family SH3 domain-containing protein [Shewanella aestuarii]|uniref:TIGR04211 family SH3 domain-containing protein n=2 Tax=Shewanella aestuarii TaxID=1028752 RepID=A0A6G9QQI9_9GAMM|nr:TIGR04211 family SH3 domain-containing protein [Shewanella aestuarii]
MTANAQGASHYISDDVFTYIHGGPGTQYRILGSVEAGQPVKFLDKTDGDYSLIVDHKGREGWVRSDLVTDQPSFRERFPTVESELIKVNEQLNQITLTTDNATQDLVLANRRIAALEAALSKAENERDVAKSKVQAASDAKQFQMWQQGGLIAGLGALIGIILVYLPRPQRRKKNRWM